MWYNIVIMSNNHTFRGTGSHGRTPEMYYSQATKTNQAAITKQLELFHEIKNSLDPIKYIREYIVTDEDVVSIHKNLFELATTGVDLGNYTEKREELREEVIMLIQVKLTQLSLTF